MTELERRLGLIRGLALTLGVVVGSGIFILPAYVASLLTIPRDFVLVWALGGLLSLATAFCYAELATTFPQTGGYVVYVRRIFGERLALVYGWAAVFILYPASIAGLARVFGSSVLDLLGVGGENVPVSLAAVAIAIGVNAWGVGISSRAQVVLTGLKVGVLALLVLLGASGIGAPPAPTAAQPMVAAGPAAWFLGLVAVFWCFEGFLEIVVVAGEVARPARNLVRILTLGVLTVTALYAMFAWVLVRRVGMDTMVGHDAVAAELARRLVGSVGGSAVSAAVALATFSAVVSLLFSGPRILVAMARSGLFFAAAGNVTDKHRTPVAAVITCGIIAMVYAATGTFVELVKYFSFMAGLFSILIVGGGVWLRVRGRIPPSCRRIPGWPVPAVLSVAATAGGVVYVAYDQPRASAVGLALLGLAALLSLRWRGPAKATG